MENNRYMLIGVVVVALILIGVALVVRNGGNEPVEPSATTTPTDTLPMTINVKHLFADGMHRYHGVFTTPTPCYDVSAEVIAPATTGTIDSPSPYRISITSSEQEGAACAQVLTDKEFDVSFEGPVDATVVATLNGKEVRLNVLEVDSPEDLRGPFDFKS